MAFEEWFGFSRWEEHPVGPSRPMARDAWDAATAAERERCERICDEIADAYEHKPMTEEVRAAWGMNRAIAAAIREGRDNDV